MNSLKKIYLNKISRNMNCLKSIFFSRNITNWNFILTNGQKQKFLNYIN